MSSTEFESNITLSNMAHMAENMTEQDKPFRLENFSYKNDIVVETMFKHLENTDFVGVSVRNKSLYTFRPTFAIHKH